MKDPLDLVADLKLPADSQIRVSYDTIIEVIAVTVCE